jgi:hypothetical protein
LLRNTVAFFQKKEEKYHGETETENTFPKKLKNNWERQKLKKVSQKKLKNSLGGSEN